VAAPWATAALGAIVALAVGLALTVIVAWLWAGAVGGVLSAVQSTPAGPYLSGFVQSLLTPNVLQMFAVEHRIPLSMQIAATAGPGLSVSGSITLSTPLTTLLVVPALALVLGGVIAGASDLRRRPGRSIARGALVGPFYAALLAVLAVFSASDVSGNAYGINGSVSIGPSVSAALFYGLLWGTLFGALGGWIQLTGGAFLASALPALLRLKPSRLIGALSGAGVAFVGGLLGGMALALAGASYLGVRADSGVTPVNSPGLAILLALILAPSLAVAGFALASGASVDVFQSASLPRLVAHSSALGAFGVARPLLPTAYLLTSLPILCYLLGGRVAARLAGADRPRAAAIDGALMGVPLSLLITLAALLASASEAIRLPGQEAMAGVAPSAGRTFLAVLIAGAVCGGLGGISTLAAPRLVALPDAVRLRVRRLGASIVLPLDRLMGQPVGKVHSGARLWLYAATLAAVGLGALPILLGPLSQVRWLDAVVVALLVGVPLLCCVAALLAALVAPFGDMGTGAQTLHRQPPARSGAPWLDIPE
jgi:hypothetical protein